MSLAFSHDSRLETLLTTLLFQEHQPFTMEFTVIFPRLTFDGESLVTLYLNRLSFDFQCQLSVNVLHDCSNYKHPVSIKSQTFEGIVIQSNGITP